jgi:hypothetical protein
VSQRKRRGVEPSVVEVKVVAFSLVLVVFLIPRINDIPVFFSVVPYLCGGDGAAVVPFHEHG